MPVLSQGPIAFDSLVFLFQVLVDVYFRNLLWRPFRWTGVHNSEAASNAEAHIHLLDCRAGLDNNKWLLGCFLTLFWCFCLFDTFPVSFLYSITSKPEYFKWNLYRRYHLLDDRYGASDSQMTTHMFQLS